MRGKFEGEDSFIEAQPASERRAVADIWAMRASLELSVSAGYAIIVRELLENGADKIVLEHCCWAASEEIEHAQICLDLAERLDGKKRDWPRPASLHVPAYQGVGTGPLLAALHLVAMSCLNETIACARLLEAMRPTKSPSIKHALRAILSDEIKHARAGWAHLASVHVSVLMKRQIAEFIPHIIRESLISLIEENAAIPTQDYLAFGLPSVNDARTHAHQAISDIVVPGFVKLGVPIDRERALQMLAVPL